VSSGSCFFLSLFFDMQPGVTVSSGASCPWCVFQKAVRIGQIAAHIALFLGAQAGIEPFDDRRFTIVFSDWKMIRFTTLLERYKIIAVKWPSHFPESDYSRMFTH